MEHKLKDHYSILSRHIEESLKPLLDETSNHSLKAEALLENVFSRIRYERFGIADEKPPSSDINAITETLSNVSPANTNDCTGTNVVGENKSIVMVPTEQSEGSVIRD